MTEYKLTENEEKNMTKVGLTRPTVVIFCHLIPRANTNDTNYEFQKTLEHNNTVFRLNKYLSNMNTNIPVSTI